MRFLPSFPHLLPIGPLAACMSLALLSGCATEGAVEGSTVTLPRNHLAPFLEAPERTRLECRSETPLSIKTPAKNVVFVCPQLEARATLPELQDAGWRLINLDIGQDFTQDGVVCLPLTITVVKLF